MPKTYRIIRSKYAGKCAGCGTRWDIGDYIYAFDGEYYCRSSCVNVVDPLAVQESTGENVATASTVVSVASNANEGICPPPVTVPPKWEIVTGDDGIIVLRRLP